MLHFSGWCRSRCVVSVARRPSTAELERDVLGLSFDKLSGCVGLTELVEGYLSKELTMRPNLRRLTCLIRPSARDHSAPARLRGHRKPPRTQTNQKKRRAELARIWGLLPGALYSPDSLLGEPRKQPRTFGVFPGPLASDHARSVCPPWALATLGFASERVSVSLIVKTFRNNRPAQFGWLVPGVASSRARPRSR